MGTFLQVDSTPSDASLGSVDESPELAQQQLPNTRKEGGATAACDWDQWRPIKDVGSNAAV